MNEDGLFPAAADEPSSSAPTTKGTAKAVAAPKKAATRQAAKKTAPTKKTAPSKKTGSAENAGPANRAGCQRGPAANSFPTEKSGSIDGLLAAKEIVIACGPGGVGKTTTAAAA